MVDKNINHKNAFTHDLYLWRKSGWQNNPNRKYEQESDVCSLSGKEKISWRQVCQGSKTNSDLLKRPATTNYELESSIEYLDDWGPHEI